MLVAIASAVRAEALQGQRKAGPRYQNHQNPGLAPGFLFLGERGRAVVTCYTRSAILQRYAYARYTLERAPHDFLKSLGANRRERA